MGANYVFWLSVQLTMLVPNIAMVVIGVQYDNVCTEDSYCVMEMSCNIQIVPNFLKIGGAIMVALIALHVFCGMCCSPPSDGDMEGNKHLAKGSCAIIG